MGVLGQSRDKGAAAVAAPMSGPVDRTGFFENIGAGFHQAVAGPHSTRVGEAIYQTRTYDQIIKALQAEGEQGEDTLTITARPTTVKRPFRNPYVSQPWENLLNPGYNPVTALYGGGDRGEIDQIWKAVQRVRQRKPDFLKAFPNEGALAAYTIAQRQKDQVASQAVTSRATAGGTVGGFIGGMAGSVGSMDPENVVGGGFGTAVGKTFARTVIKRAVEGAGANAAASLIAAPGMIADANRLGEGMTPGDVAHQVVQSAGIGAILGTTHVVAPRLPGAVKAGAGATVDFAARHSETARNALVARSLAAGTVQDRSLLTEWARTHHPDGIVDTASPDERAAAHVIDRDATNKEVSPLHPEAASHNDNRLAAVAQALGVDLSTPELPSSAPIQHATVRTATGRRPASYDEGLHSAEGTTRNPDSTADGHFQFTEGTWLEYAPRVTDTKGKSRAEILALRHDLPTAQKAEQLFRADNGRYLQDHGLEDSPGNLSLAHFLGKGDAAKVLKADPSTPIERLIDPASYRANQKVLAGKSASEVVAWAHRRIGATVDMPVARADAVGEADPLDPADYSDVPYERATFKPDQVETDAALMQYKSGGDEHGNTGKLKDVTAWNPLMSSEILVWEGNDGRKVVVDGHQRVGLARRLAQEGQEADLPALVVREADGITAAQARTLGALRNINLGTGSLIDNARVLRDVPDAAEHLKGAESRREIQGLANLNYEAFGAAINGVIDPRIAAEIGKYAPPEAHMAMVDLLARERISNPAEAASIVRQAMADGFGTQAEHQLSLLGDQPQQSLYVPIARILSAAQKKLREEKRTFKVLGEKAGRIEAAGNVLDRTANEEKVIGSDEALAILNATAHRAGPVRDALIAAARAELSGARRADAVGGFLDSLAGIDLRAAAEGASQDGALGEPSGETGGRDAAAASDILLSERNEPSLFDHAVAAKAEAEPFSDPVGEGAKAQADILEHDLMMDAVAAQPPALGPDNFAASTFYYDGGLRERRAGNWAPKDDQVSLANFEDGLKPGTSAVELRRVKLKGDNLTWVAVAYPSIDAKFGDRLNVAKVGVWLKNAEITDARGLLAELDRLSAWAADPKNARDVASSEMHGAEVKALVADLPRYTKAMDANSAPTAFGPTRFPEREKLSAKGLDDAAAQIEALSRDPHSKPLAVVTVDHAAEPVAHVEAPRSPDVAAAQDRPAAAQETVAVQQPQTPPPAESVAPTTPSLFDLPETGHRLSEEGDAKPLAEIMREAEDDTLAAKALRDCLKGGGE